jgi:hypothetical protein
MTRISGRTQSRGRAHGHSGLRGRAKSARKLRATLRATSLQNHAATSGGHAGPEAMSAFSLCSTWLICAFHG